MNRFEIFLLSIVLAITSLGWTGAASAADAGSSKNNLNDIQVLDLPTAARIALADNPTLAVAQARVEQAREVLNQARSAYWPRVDLNASGTRVELSDNAHQSQMALYGTSIDNPQDYYRASLAASWVLFDGFARKFSVAAATYGEQLYAAAKDDTRRLLLQAVAGAFLSAQYSLENIAIARADESFNRRQLTEAKLRYDVGTGALSDVLNFEVRVNTAQSDRIVAERAYQTDRVALATLLGVPHARLPADTQLAPLESVAPERMETPDFEQLVEIAFDRRPDLTQNDRAVQQAEADVEVRKSNYYPTVSLAASYDGERVDDLGFESQDFGNSVGIILSYNIFAGGLYKAQHQQAKARLHEVEKQRENSKITVASQVQTSVERVLSAQKQLVLQRTNAELVQRNRELVEKEYKAGVGSLVRLNEAQRDLTAAQVRLASAQTALYQAWYDLQSATGQILDTFAP